MSGLEHSSGGDWALFDGQVEVRTVLLDFAESPVLAQLTAELVAAIETHEHAVGLARLTLAARIRTLTARIERRMNLQPVKLQNRDRSTAASIAQVQSIAKNPDPDLLGYNKTPTEGAPIVFADYDEMSIPAALLGRKATVTFTKDMSKAPVQFAVVPADDVMVSHDFNGMPVAGYDALEAPTGKLRAVAGNGRAAGIQLAYEKGTATNYVAGLIEEADMLQLDAGAIAALARPMLVRIMRHGDVTADIGDKTNSSGMAGFSAVEQAKTDADRIDFANLSFNDDGTPTLDALTRFVRAMPIAEQAALAPDGSPTNQALDRLMAATFNRAYQNDDLVKLYSQSLDPEIKNVLFGMAQAAGDMAALQGKGEYDIRSFVTDAATMASNAKRSGLPLSRIAEQRDMGMADESNDIAALFARNARSAKRIADALRSLARAALAQADAEDEDMFGPVAKVPPADLVREATGTALLDSVSMLDAADDDLRAKLAALQSLGAGSVLERIRLAREIEVLTATVVAPPVKPIAVASPPATKAVMDHCLAEWKGIDRTQPVGYIAAVIRRTGVPIAFVSGTLNRPTYKAVVHEATALGLDPAKINFYCQFATYQGQGINVIQYSELATPLPEASFTLMNPSRADVIAQQERIELADAHDESARIDRETAAQLLTRQSAPDQRKDTSGDMFAMEKAQATIEARKANGKTQEGPGLFDSTGARLTALQ